MPERIQMRRTKGWRKPHGVIYCGRPGPYGNPFPVDGDWITWAAVAAGYRADRRGRQQAAVAFHRAWMTGEDIEPGQVHLRCVGTVEYSDGSTCTVGDHARGVALVAANLFDGPILPERPSLDALRGHDLGCWCGLSDPCHVDVLLDLANRPGPGPRRAGQWGVTPRDCPSRSHR